MGLQLPDPQFDSGWYLQKTDVKTSVFLFCTQLRSNVIIKEAQAVQENVFDYIESKAQTKGERVSEASRNFVNDCLNFVKEFVEKEREQ